MHENNLLIAEFMDYNKDGYWYKTSKDLCYHDEWNWLIPVVEMIERIEINITQSFRVKIEKGCCYIDVWRAGEFGFSNFLRQEGTSKIESTYLAVVKFIKLYNRLENKNEREVLDILYEDYNRYREHKI